MNDARTLLEQLFHCGIKAVAGEHAISSHFASSTFDQPDAILAVGKAACAMYQGVPGKIRENADALIITKVGHSLHELSANPKLRILESGHPIPNEKSLHAGNTALDFVRNLPSYSNLLLLVSGGASALVEVPKDGYDLEKLVNLTDQCLAEGDDIEVINEKRSRMSLIKKGGLLSCFNGERVVSLAISDVEGDNINIIGSGIGAAVAPSFDYKSHIVASNQIARAAIEQKAQNEDINVVHNLETLYADIHIAAEQIFETVSEGPGGLYIFGGEPTVMLPEKPGQGGRNQALGLLLAKYFSGDDSVTCLVAGTDGTDGPTQAAGSIVDGRTYRTPAADEALKLANSGSYLEKQGDLFVTGPTGTNVMDIALVLKDQAVVA